MTSTNAPVSALSVSIEEARAILGRSLFDADDIITHLSRTFLDDAEPQKVVPFDSATLQGRRLDHLLVQVPAISILEMRTIFRDVVHTPSNHWYDNARFATDPGVSGWYLVRKGILPNSTNKTLKEQTSLLGPRETVPSVRVLLYTALISFIKGQDVLFMGDSARCRDIFQRSRTSIRYEDREFIIGGGSGGIKSDFIGLASVVEPPIANL